MTTDETKLLLTLASISRSSLKAGCREQRILTKLMHKVSGSAREHLRREAALRRDMRKPDINSKDGAKDDKTPTDPNL